MTIYNRHYALPELYSQDSFGLRVRDPHLAVLMLDSWGQDVTVKRERCGYCKTNNPTNTGNCHSCGAPL